MKLTDFKVYYFRLPLTQPLWLRGKKIVFREGWALCLIGDSGAEGWGNIMPLPGVSSENLEIAKKQLLDFRSMWKKFGEPTNSQAFRKTLLLIFNSISLAPSVRCGLEMALWNWAAASSQQSLSQWLSPNPSSKVGVNGLLHGPLEKISREAQEMVFQGYKTVKLKVGNPDVEEDIVRTRKVQEIIGNNVTLRLDANRSWNRKEATHFAKAVSSCKIDYIEEPFSNPEEFTLFAKETSLPVALDETLFEPGRRFELEGIKALILKPPFLGGLEQTFQWTEKARRHHIVPVISCAFESGIGVRTLAHMGSVLVGQEIPLGLDPYRWLEQDLLEPRIVIQNGEINIGSLNRCKINFSRLEEIHD